MGGATIQTSTRQAMGRSVYLLHSPSQYDVSISLSLCKCLIAHNTNVSSSLSNWTTSSAKSVMMTETLQTQGAVHM